MVGGINQRLTLPSRAPVIWYQMTPLASVHGGRLLDLSGLPTLSPCLTSSVRHPRQEWMKRSLGLAQTPAINMSLGVEGGGGGRGVAVERSLQN